MSSAGIPIVLIPNISLLYIRVHFVAPSFQDPAHRLITSWSFARITLLFQALPWRVFSRLHKPAHLTRRAQCCRQNSEPWVSRTCPKVISVAFPPTRQSPVDLSHIRPTRPHVVDTPATASGVNPHIIHTPPTPSRLALNNTRA